MFNPLLRISDLAPEQAVVLLIQAAKVVNRDSGHPERIACHWRYSGAERVWKKAFPTVDAYDVLESMVRKGKLILRTTRQGSPLYWLPEDWRDYRVGKEVPMEVIERMMRQEA